MVNNYTDFSLIKYLYQDTDICEKLEVEHLLEFDSDAKDRYNAFKYLTNLLSGVNFSPNSLNIQKLIQYSQIEDVQAN
jgi:hypothetical protein